jgi:isopenicillin N synthase-like dioxygenase
VEAVVEQLTGIGARLMRAIALALGLHPDAFQHCFQPWPNIQYKVARYLCPEDETSLSGVGAHSDSGMLTLLIQDGTGGLEAQLADGGAWIAVPPRKGMLVVNLGEMLQVATQGYFLATVHRVVNTKGKQRISFPFFYNAALSSPMRLCSAHGLPFQISDGLPWERVSRDRDARNWRDDQNQMLDIYGDNALKSLVSCP